MLKLRDLKNARNKVAHGYDGVDYEVLWTTLSHSIPETMSEVRSLLEDE